MKYLFLLLLSSTLFANVEVRQKLIEIKELNHQLMSLEAGFWSYAGSTSQKLAQREAMKKELLEKFQELKDFNYHLPLSLLGNAQRVPKVFITVNREYTPWQDQFRVENESGTIKKMSEDLKQKRQQVLDAYVSNNNPDIYPLYQTMHVYIDGVLQYQFPVSTGRYRYIPSMDKYTIKTSLGFFRPNVGRTYLPYFSGAYEGADMPFAMFFFGGVATHGTVRSKFKYLGESSDSGGCVRLYPWHAALLNKEVLLAGDEQTYFENQETVDQLIQDVVDIYTHPRVNIINGLNDFNNEAPSELLTQALKANKKVWGYNYKFSVPVSEVERWTGGPSSHNIESFDVLIRVFE